MVVQDLEARHISARSRQPGAGSASAGGGGSSSAGGGGDSGSSSGAEVAADADVQADAEGGIDGAQVAHLYERAAAPLSSAVPSSDGSEFPATFRRMRLSSRFWSGRALPNRMPIKSVKANSQYGFGLV